MLYVNPTKRNQIKKAQEVHGISNEDLKDKPFFLKCSEDLLEFIDGSTLVIHNADFDVVFQMLNLKQHRQPIHQFLRFVKLKIHLQLQEISFQDKGIPSTHFQNVFDINGYDRSYHGALLDANILADVYSNLTGGQSKINFANNFDADLQEENKKQTRDFSNDFEITKIITSEEDQLLHSKRLVRD